MMLLTLAMLLLLIACFLAMAGLVFFCEDVIDVSVSHPIDVPHHSHNDRKVPVAFRPGG
jgi:hypothetical protein